jgi:hypothetical protein
MLTRRQFLSRSTLATLGAAGSAFALPSEARDDLPDGSASRDMVTTKAEEAINRGLSYLARMQNGDGTFGRSNYRWNVAVSSLAGLAFMAGGHQPSRGQYGYVVSKALGAVLDAADNIGGAMVGQMAAPPGFLHHSRDNSHGPMYGHGFGTLFLAEVYGMVEDEALRDKLHDTLTKAITVILGSQNDEGGWRYYPNRKEADLSVTICQIMALRSARNAGFYVPKALVDKCVKYVKDCRDSRFGSFRYQRQFNNGPRDAFARTAAGVCALYSAGIYRGPEIEQGLQFLVNNHPNTWGLPPRDMNYFYGHYYAAQVMWTAGGAYWSDWFPYIREELISPSMVSPEGYWTDPICPEYATAMACIILQIPNNYLPIFQK